MDPRAVQRSGVLPFYGGSPRRRVKRVSRDGLAGHVPRMSLAPGHSEHPPPSQGSRSPGPTIGRRSRWAPLALTVRVLAGACVF